MEINEAYLNPRYGAQLLGTMPMFKGFSEEELERIYSAGEIRLFNAGANVIIEGETSSGFYLILEGSVGIYKSGRSGLTDHRLSSLSAGKAFGEMSLIDQKPRSATVVSEGRTVVFALDGGVWESIALDDPRTAARFYANFALMLSNRLRALDEEFILGQKQLWKFALAREHT